MPHTIPVALAAAVLLVAGCSATSSQPTLSSAAVHSEAPTPPTPQPAAEHALYVKPAAPVAAPAASVTAPAAVARPSLLTIYLGVGTEPNAGFAKQVLDATVADLRERGYDVRGSSTYPTANQRSASFAPLLAQAAALNQGATVAPTQRAATYLHVNSPRLLFVASLESTPDKNLFNKPVQRVSIAGFLCETTTGEVVWSGHTTLTDAAPDHEIAQKLAAALLRSAPKRTAASD